MRLLQLRLQNVGQIQRAKLDLSSPVTYFGGKNESGKSTIRHAINYAFTEKVRGCKQIKESLSLRSNGADLAQVLLTREIDGFPDTIQRSMPKRKGDAEERFDLPALRIALDPMWFISLGKEQRAKLLSEIIGTNVDKAAILKREIHETTDVFDEITIQIGDVDYADPDAVEAAVVSLRKSYKREREGYLEKNTPTRETYGASELTVQQYNTEIDNQTEAVNKLKQTISDAAHGKNLLNEINGDNALIEDYKKQITAGVTEKIVTLAEELESLELNEENYDNKVRLESDITGYREEIRQFELAIEVIPVDLEQVGKDAAVIASNIELLGKARDAKQCPICGSDMLKGMIDQQLKELKQAAKGQADLIKEWHSTAQENKARKEIIGNYNQSITVKAEELEPVKDAKSQAEKIGKTRDKKEKLELKDLKNGKLNGAIHICEGLIEQYELSLSKVETAVPDNSEKTVTDTEAAIELLKTSRAKRQMYENAENVHTEGQSRKEELDSLIDETDRLADLLKPGGLVREEFNRSGKQIPYNKKLAEAWGFRDFQMSDDGSLMCSSQTIQKDGVIVASESQRYRIAALVAMALAEVSGVGFVLLDGIDILDSDNINSLFRCVKDSALESIILFGTTTSDLSEQPKRDWLKVYQLRVDRSQTIITEAS